MDSKPFVEKSRKIGSNLLEHAIRAACRSEFFEGDAKDYNDGMVDAEVVYVDGTPFLVTLKTGIELKRLEADRSWHKDDCAGNQPEFNRTLRWMDITVSPNSSILREMGNGMRPYSDDMGQGASHMGETITQHVITKGGEFYSREIGVMEDFEPNAYMAEITNIPPYDLIQATEDTFVSFDSVLRLWFTRTDVH